MMSSTARAIIYICCIGGLLVLHALVVVVLWNQVFDDIIPTDRTLTFLEGAGITAFAYVGAFGIRHALEARRQGITHRRPQTPRHERVVDIREATKPTEPSYPDERSSPTSAVRERCTQLSTEDKARLRQALAQQCGCIDRRAHEQNG